VANLPYNLISRQEAIALGLKRYFTGKPCKYGHIAERWVLNWTCLLCDNAACKQIYQQLRPERLARMAKWAADNPERVKEQARSAARRRRAENPEPGRIYQREWAQQNRERRRATNKAWWDANPYKRALYNTMRRAAARRPLWADRAEIESIYQRCPSGMTVDHIVPLGTEASPALTTEGYPVCGLHVPWNLQYLTGIENSRKRNRMRPEDATR
jgi:hypothetical protein